MKITDALTLFYKSNPPPPSSQSSGIKPVPVIDRAALHPGQIFHGEVLGTDTKGHLLLKVGGEIIATRSLVSMEVGQQAWVEVKKVGDSPIFALAEAKGAVQELLKSIMEVRPVVLAPDKGETVLPTDFQAGRQPSSSPSFIPKLSPLNSDGALPRETMQLLRAFVDLSKMEVPVLSETKLQQLTPFLSPDNAQVDIGKVVAMLQETGRIPPVVGELEPLRPLFYFNGGGKGEGAVRGAEPLAPVMQQGVSEEVVPSVSALDRPVVAPPSAAGGSASPVPFITSEGQVVSHVMPVVHTLVEAVALAHGVKVEDLSSHDLGKGVVDLSKVMLVDGKIPNYIRELEPMKQLLQPPQMIWAKGGELLQATTAEEFVQGFAQTALEGQKLSPMQYNETVVKVLSGLQGAEPKPELLQVLKQLVSSGVKPHEKVEGDTEKAILKQQDVATGLAKAASFFDSHAVVNREVAQVGPGDSVLVPCFFSGQSGWGEWLWSHDSGQENEQGQSQEHLAFFLEMTHIGPVAIQVILGENSIAGQFSVANETVYGLVEAALPALEERLAGLGYGAQFTCRKKSVAVMQDIKDSLETRTRETGPSSLVDVQA